MDKYRQDGQYFPQISQERVGLSAEQMLADALHLKLV
jgi:hypothetical protein